MENEKEKTNRFVNITNKAPVPKLEPITPTKTHNTSRKPNYDNYVKISIRGVQVAVVHDAEEDYTLITSLEDVLKLDKKKPNNIVGFIPELYKEFINTKTMSLKTFVSVNDLVIVNDKFKKGLNLPRVVTNVYLKSLNNMTVVVAELNDGDIILANHLELCK